MGRRLILLLLTLGLLCLALFLGFDYGTAALGRHLVKARLEDSLRGDCSLADASSVRLARSLGELSVSLLPSPVPKELNGLRLSIKVSPFNMESNESLVTFREMEPWVLRVGVDDDVWVMQEPGLSSTTVERPIHNANFIALAALMLVEDMAPGIFEQRFQMLPVTFRNMSILERVSEAWQKIEFMMDLYNHTTDNNILRQLYSFLSRGNGSALVYDGYSFHVAGRNLSDGRRRVRSLPPLSLVPIQYHLPGLPDLTWEYWKSGAGMLGAAVIQYKVTDIWKPNLLCRLNDHILYNIRSRVQGYGVFMAPPESLQSQNFAVKWSGEAPFSAVLNVYGPLGVPIGGSLAVQLNIYIPRNEINDVLPGEITPVARVMAEVDQLPEETMVWLARFMLIRTVVLLVLAGFCIVLLVAAIVAIGSSRRRATLTRPFHEPL